MFATRNLTDDNLERGAQIGDYSLLELIGRGGEGVVWSAWDNRQQRVVAMKILSTVGQDPTMVASTSRDFERQVHLLASLDHPGILPLYEFGSTATNYYFVMRYNATGSLANRLLAGPLPLPETLRIVAQMAEALGYLHARGVVHRDLKPNNILLSSQDRMFLSDFGLAKQLWQETLPFHTGRGTGPYAPYEQHIQYGMSPQSDIFSLGIVVYEMLTGHLPWEGSAFLAIEQKQEGAELPDLRETDPSMPAGLTTALRTLTAFSHQNRPATAVDALNLLLKAVPDLPPDAALSLRAPLPPVDEMYLSTQDAAFLLNLFVNDWQGAAEAFPARLTHVALVDAAASHKGAYSLKLNQEQAAFMLRGALVYDYHIDYWWRQVADPAIQARVCVETVGQEEGTAVTRALARLNDLVNQEAVITLDPATQERLLEMVAEAESWSLRDNALQILAATLPKPSQWQPVALSPTADARLAELALSESNHANQAAALIGQIRSETAVQAIVAAAPQIDIQEILQRIQAEAGSLPGIVPARLRWRVRVAQMRQRLFTDTEGLSVPRVAIGLLAGVVISVVMVWGLFSQPAVQMQDVLLAPYPVSGIVTIVEVDDASLARYGRWDGWSRALHADLVNHLNEAGARVIALDFLFDAASADAAADAQLQEAMAAAGSVVQPVLGPDAAHHDVPGAFRFDERLLPYAPFLAASAAVGHTNILHDEDGYVRQMPTVMTVAEERYLSLPLMALLVYLGGQASAATIPMVEEGVLPFLGRHIPVGPLGELNIYFAGPPATPEEQTFRMVSYADVLEGRVPDSAFNGKIVLVGITATSALESDSYLTPVSRGRPMYGVEILANVIESVWSEHFIDQPSLVVRIGVLLLLGVLTGLVCIRPWSGLFFAGVLAVLYFLAAIALFDLRSILLDLLYPFMTIGLSYALVTAYRFSAEIRRRREMMQLFSANVTPDVARAAMTAVRKGDINLGGEVQEVTVLFADMRGRRSFADLHEPGEVIALMNEMRDMVRQIVLAHEGTVVHQEGEQVMALFNVPLPQPDHAWLAVETAFSIRERLQAVQDGLPSQHPHQVIKIGYGIATGRVIVGNVGPAPHHTYTAVGEAVTVSAHLAGQAAADELIVAESTFERVGDKLVAEPLPPVLVKDQSNAVAVYTAVGRSNGAA